MSDAPKPLNSPLDRIQNLQAVDPAKAAALENRLKKKYVAGMTEYLREARLRSEQVQDKVIY